MSREIARTWTDDDLIETIKNSKTKLEVLKKLGLKIPASYRMLNKYIKLLNIDVSHFESGRMIAQKQNPAAELTEILTSNSSFDYRYVKRRILEANLLEVKCAMCAITSWQNRPLTLHLDHINGVNNDHRLENLRLLCPNCHSQTETYCGRNQKKTKKENFCACGAKIGNTSKTCRKCMPQRGKATWPPTAEIISGIKSTSLAAFARTLNIRPSSAKKYLRNRGLWPLP